MGTTLRAELSEKNPYWIEKHRYYELKHFCLQYPIWKKAYAALDGTNTKTMNLAMRVITNNIDDPTSRYTILNIRNYQMKKSVQNCFCADLKQIS